MRPFHIFSQEDSAVWHDLFIRQWANAQRYAARWWLEGAELLALTPDHIPDFAALSERIHDLTRWRLVSTNVQYSLGSLWWYTIEFGLIREDGALKALGAGLLGSAAELQRAYSNAVTLAPYTLKAFDALSPSPHHLHNTLFILDSWQQIERSIDEWAELRPAPMPLTL